jgi:ankyrin repeat protein
MERVLELLQLGASPKEWHPEEGYSALHGAAGWGHLNVVKELMQHGADPNGQSHNGQSPLSLAAAIGSTDTAAALLEGKADVNHADLYQRTPLHEAALGGSFAVMQLLLDAGARADAADMLQVMPLHEACKASQPEAVSLLLAQGAAVAAACSRGYTPLHHACEKGHLEVAQVLLGAGAPVDAMTHDKQTPLFLSTRGSQEQLVRLLLRRGAQPHIPDSSGLCALHVAADRGCAEAVRCLLRADATPEHVNAACSMGHTALLLASSRGHSEVVQLLVAAGANPGAATAEGTTAVHYAAKNRNLAMLQALLAGMTPEQARGVLGLQRKGVTPLHVAAEKGLTSHVEVLMAAGADPNQLYGAAAVTTGGGSLAGATSLHPAVQLRHKGLVPLLATPSNMRREWGGRTPLHLALSAVKRAQYDCSSPAVKMAQALVAAGSPAGVPNRKGVTAMSMAASSKNAALTALLPAMVRRECEMCKEHQEDTAAQQQQKGAGKQQAPALPAAVASSMYALAAAAGRPAETPRLGTACFKGVMEVLGEAAAGSLLQQLLAKAGSKTGKAAGSRVPLQLAQMMHKGWFSEVLPLMQRRWRVINRMEKLLPDPTRHQNQQPQPQQAPTGMPCAFSQCPGLSAQAAAAARAGQWPLFVQLLDQLTGLHEACGAAVVCVLEQQQGVEGAPDMAKACEVLLGAWVAARQQVAGRMRQELAGAVVEAVQAAKERWGVLH